MRDNIARSCLTPRQGFVTLLLALLLAPAAFGQAAKVGDKVGPPLKAALDAAQKNQFPEALARLREADAVTGKTAFEQHQINEAYCSVYSRQRNYGAALTACEKGLTSGQLTGSAAEQRLKTLAQIAFQTQPRNLAKTIEYGNRYLQGGGANDGAVHYLVGQAHYLGGNYRAAVTSMNNAARLSERGGGKVEENVLRYLLDSYTRLNDQEGVTRVTTQLVRLYPSKDNWRRLTAAVRRTANDDRTQLHVYRLMYELDVMDRPDVYSDAAIVAIQADLPGEALRIMERGQANKAFDQVTDADRARNQRIVAQARQKLEERQAQLPAAEAAATARTQGDADIRIGEAYLGLNEPAKAAAAIRRGLDKGGVPDLDQAHMLLGQAYVRMNNRAEAQKAFREVKGEDLLQIARLWGIYAGQS